MFDFIIIGGGPAGLSAAITGSQRGKSVAIVSNDCSKSGLYKAKEIRNYPGFPLISGPDLLYTLSDHAKVMGAELISGMVNTVVHAGGAFHVGYDLQIIQSKALILATGVVQSSLFPGEVRFLGNGVSYCATCDGMLYRGKRVCVVCLKSDADEEADYLKSIGCEVTRVYTKKVVINGDTKVSSVVADDEEIKCDGVFVLRQAIAPNLLLPDLKLIDKHIMVGKMGETSIPGVFAAGDCVGTPYQISKAVGEGLIAALAADEYIAAGLPNTGVKK